MKPHILFVHSNAEMYGADFILLEVVRGLRDNFLITVALPGSGPLHQALVDEGVEVVTTNDSVLRRSQLHPARFAWFLWSLVRDTFRLARLARERRSALIYSNTAAVMSGALAAKLSRTRHLYHIHEIIVSPSWLRSFMARFIASTSHRVIAVSQAVRRHLLETVPHAADAVTVIHNGLDTARFVPSPRRQEVRSELGAGTTDVLVGVVGRIHPWKGQEVFVRAAAILAKSSPKARFVVIGGTFRGYERLVGELHALRESLGLNDQLRILPHRTDVPAVMEALDVFVLPSTLPDPLPTVVLEAMASGRPVIATRHGGAPEMVVEGTTGLLVPPNDPAALASAIGSVVSDERMRHSLGEAGRQRIATAFSRHTFLDRITQTVTASLADGPK